MQVFSAVIKKLDINPCVDVPDKVIQQLLKQAKKQNGPLPVRGRINGAHFETTVVKYAGAWRLYLNNQMRRNANVDVKDRIEVQLAFDPNPRLVATPEKFAAALSKNKNAKRAFEKLPPSRQKEILRYMNSLKTDASLERAIDKVIHKELMR